eukprot:758651-Hanusia_phi.AAC.1
MVGKAGKGGRRSDVLRVSFLASAILLVSFLPCAWSDERSDTVLDACGLPRNYWSVSHCFNDRTHHTCCLLGPERDCSKLCLNQSAGAQVRRCEREPDRISSIQGVSGLLGWNEVRCSHALSYLKAKHGADPTDKDLTPWCTCFGSLVQEEEATWSSE